jgi:hypothetical protein
MDVMLSRALEGVDRGRDGDDAGIATVSPTATVSAIASSAAPQLGQERTPAEAVAPQVTHCAISDQTMVTQR